MKRIHKAAVIAVTIFFFGFTGGNAATIQTIRPTAPATTPIQVKPDTNPIRKSPTPQITPTQEREKETSQPVKKTIKPVRPTLSELSDLSVRALTASPVKVNKGDRITAVAQIHNEGKSALREVTVQFSFAGRPQGRIQKITIPAGATTPLRMSIVADTVGTQMLAVAVDTSEAIVEKDEKNNSRQLMVTVALPAALSHTGGPADIKKNLETKAAMPNQRLKATSAPPKLSAQQVETNNKEKENVQPFLAPAYSLSNKAVKYPDLAASSSGYCCTEKGIGRKPEKTCSDLGGRYFKEMGDALRVCMKKDTSMPGQITLVEKPTFVLDRPDLISLQVAMDSDSDKLVINTEPTVRILVKNTGTVKSPPAMANIVVKSTHLVSSCPFAFQNFPQQMPELDPGQEHWLTATFMVTADMRGQISVWAGTDPGNGVAEQNENNNEIIAYYDVFSPDDILAEEGSPKSQFDLVVESASIDSADMVFVVGQSYNVAATVRNRGQQKTPATDVTFTFWHPSGGPSMAVSVAVPGLNYRETHTVEAVFTPDISMLGLLGMHVMVDAGKSVVENNEDNNGFIVGGLSVNQLDSDAADADSPLDLALADLIVDMPEPYAVVGDTSQITIRVENTGSEATPETEGHLEVKFRTDSTQSYQTMHETSFQVPPLQPGAHTETLQEVLLTGQPSSLLMVAKVDSTNSLNENNENNNIRIAASSVYRPAINGVDLSVSGLQASLTKPAPSTVSADISYIVANHGSADSPQAEARIYVRQTRSCDSGPTWRQVYSDPDAYSENYNPHIPYDKNASFTLPLCDSANNCCITDIDQVKVELNTGAAGSFEEGPFSEGYAGYPNVATLAVTFPTEQGHVTGLDSPQLVKGTDFIGQIKRKESLELSKVEKVRPVVHFCQDLEITGMEIFGGPGGEGLVVGLPYNIVVTVKNNSKVESPEVQGQIILLDSSKTAQTYTIPSLDSGEDFVMVRPYTAPLTFAGGTLWIAAVADSSNVLAECNESNNMFEQVLPVRGVEDSY